MEWIVKIEGKDERKGARDSKEQSESESLTTFSIGIFIVLKFSGLSAIAA